MIRIAVKEDIPAILEIYAPYILNTTASFEYTVPSMEEFTERFERITAQFPWLVWEENGKVLGYAYASAPFERAGYRWCCEMSVYVSSDFHGRGIGRKLYAAVENILWLQGYRVIYAVITQENEASVRFHEAVGYRLLAVFPGCGLKFGRRLGIVWMEKQSNSGEIPSIPPVPWCTVVENDRKLADILATLSLS